MKIPIQEVKHLSEKFDLTEIIIFGRDQLGTEYVATYGRSKKQAADMAQMGNTLKDKLEWPKELCNAKPLPRICNNCSFYESEILGLALPGSGPGLGPGCVVDPVPVSRSGLLKACHRYEPEA